MSMKKLTALATLLAITANTSAESDHHHKSDHSTTIAVVNGQEIMQKSKLGQEALQKLQKNQAELTKDIEKDKKAYQEKESKFKEKSEALNKKAMEIEKNSLLSKEAKQKQFEALQGDVRELEEIKADLERLRNRITSEAQRIEAKIGQLYQEEMGKFDSLVKETIKNVAERENIDLFLMEEQVVYAKKSITKTDIIIKELDKKHTVKNKSSEKDHQDN